MPMRLCIYTNWYPPLGRTKTSDTRIPGKQEPTVAPRLPPHTNRLAHPRSTSLPRKDTTPSPPTTPKPRAHPPPTTRPNIPRAFLRRQDSTKDSIATRASSSNTHRTASTGKYQARPPAHRRRNTASPSTGKGMATSRRHKRTGATSKAGTMGRRRRTLRLRVNTRARQGTAARIAAFHMGRINMAAIPRTRRAGDPAIEKEATALLDGASQGIWKLAVKSIEPCWMGVHSQWPSYAASRRVEATTGRRWG